MAKKSRRRRTKALPKPKHRIARSTTPSPNSFIPTGIPADPISLLEDLMSSVSERQRIERNLQELTARVIDVQDQERRRIARDLHDNLGQKIMILKMNLERLAKGPNLNSEDAELLAASSTMVMSMSDEVRTVSYLLHPPLLEEAGLVSALRGLADGFSQRCGIQAGLEIDEELDELPSAVEISAYRIVQECLTNIHRHSGSSTARIRIERRDTAIQIEVQDDGRGIPAKNVMSGSGLGLSGMRERSRQLGGTLEIKSNGKGTTVTVRLPVLNESLPATSAS
jgi:two-component system NarL family sensor kinase